jgi:general secretion pathway protein G
MKDTITHRIFDRAFTLVELLVVIAILGILATIGLTAFTSSQARGRDTQRKSDLKQMASALELYYSDHGAYPSSLTGSILGCPSTTNTACTWGTGEFTDTKTTYFRVLPKDPTGSGSYFYQVVTGSSNQKFQLFAYLENSQDSSLITSGISYMCGSALCNFAITSPNTIPTE